MRRIALRNTKNKYGNTKVEYDGHTFDSKRERDAYVVLKDYESKGYISCLECQPKYELIPAIKETFVKHLKTKDKECERTVQLPITYTADFRFVKDGKTYVVDIKISPKMLPAEFKLKVKMMRYFHGIDVINIYKISDLNRFM
jgi:hypothetical protein